MPPVEVVRTYLEMTAPEQLRAAPAGPGVRVVRLARISPEGYRELYRAVGERWHWRDRDTWTDERLAEYLARPEVSIWVALTEDEAAGYAELVRQQDGSVEIAYFGLAPAFHGRGLGKVLLTRAVEEAWKLGATRVHLHTCTLDSPAALPNYLARGFAPYRRETYVTDVPGAE